MSDRSRFGWDAEDWAGITPLPDEPEDRPENDKTSSRKRKRRSRMNLAEQDAARRGERKENNK
jgi:hypothetical protein